MVGTLVNVVNQILSTHTEYASIKDIDEFKTVQVESGSDSIMDLHIGNEGASQYSIAQYVDGNARKPDTLIMLEDTGGELTPLYMDSLNFQYTEDKDQISNYANGLFASNLQTQFLQNG